MSLDVSLYSSNDATCRTCGGTGKHAEEVFEANITHNLNRMASAAGIYECVWRPEEHGFETAGQIVVPLKAGLERLKADPGTYQPYSAENGWGTYEQFIPWLEEYLAACEAHPDARIEVGR